MTNDELHDHLTRDESRNRERATRTAPPAIDVLLPYYGDLVQLQLAVRAFGPLIRMSSSSEIRVCTTSSA